VNATAGDEVPVGEVIGMILNPEEVVAEESNQQIESSSATSAMPEPKPASAAGSRERAHPIKTLVSPVAARIAVEHNIDLESVDREGERITKADVLSHLANQTTSPSAKGPARLTPASPKARRLAVERRIDIENIEGRGPHGAVLAADVLAADATPSQASETQIITLSRNWRLMAERTTQSWTSAPHFYLFRDVNASRLVKWRERAQQRLMTKVTYTDLFVKVVAEALLRHPYVNATWTDGAIHQSEKINVGLAIAGESGLVVPVIHRAEQLGLRAIAARRADLMARSRAGKLRAKDVHGGTFTISNLGMYGVDGFNAIINPPQIALLAVGRIAPRVVPADGQPDIQSMMTISLSCDHRALDGVGGARFLQTLVALMEEPLELLD
jgi:pyruvate dehydrogenase E2 component (dihydrolipoamide acetyltransferase)